MDFGRSLLAYFGFQVDTSELDKGKEKVNDFEKVINRLVSVAGGTMLARGFVHFTEGIIDAGMALSKNADKFGVSTDTLAEYDYAAQRAGVSTEQLATGLKFLEKNMAKSDGVGGKALKDFAQLGIDLGGVGADMKAPLDVLGEIADKVVAAKNPADQLGIALRFLGKGGADLLPMLKRGSAGIKELRDRFQDITGGEGGFAQFAEDAKRAHEAETDFSLGVQVLRNKFAAVFLPVMTKVLDGLMHGTVWLRELSKNTRMWETAVIALAVGGLGALMYAFGGLALAAAPWVAAMTAAYFILEDLYVFLTGGESVTGAFLDSFFGKGTAQKVHDQIKEVVDSVKSFLKEEGPKIKEAWEQDILPALKNVYELIKDNKSVVYDVFGTMLKLSNGIADAWRAISDTEAFKKLFGVGESDKKEFQNIATDLALGPLGAILGAGRSLGGLGFTSTRYKGLNPDEAGTGKRETEVPSDAGYATSRVPVNVIQHNDTKITLPQGLTDPNAAANAVKGAVDKSHADQNEAAFRSVPMP